MPAICYSRLKTRLVVRIKSDDDKQSMTSNLLLERILVFLDAELARRDAEIPLVLYVFLDRASFKPPVDT